MELKPSPSSANAVFFETILTHRSLGIKLKLKRGEAGPFQRTLGFMLSGTTQRMFHLWETNRYHLGACYLRRVNQFLSLNPVAVRIFVLTGRLQPRQKHGRRKINLQSGSGKAKLTQPPWAVSRTTALAISSISGEAFPAPTTAR